MKEKKRKMSSSSSSVLTVSLCLLLCLPLCLSSDETVTVKPGGDATLQCKGPRGTEITMIKWSKPDLKSGLYVFFYRENRPYEKFQHPSYRGRVELKDPDMKDGDVSVVLKNVTFNDAGRYQCLVVNGEGQDRTEQTSNIDLTVQVNITAKPGQSVSLPCRAPSDTHIITILVVEWTRPRLEQEYVLRYLDGWSAPENQHPSFQNRVRGKKDGDVKDGDVSIILKNVKKDDTGTYECRVVYKETDSKSGSSSGLFSIVNLQVQPGDKEGGDEGLHVGLGVGLTLLVVVVVVIISYIKCRNCSHQDDRKDARKDSTGTIQSRVSNDSDPGD